MAKNVTLRLEEQVLKEARHLAVESNRSLSKWVADLIREAVSRKSDYVAARRRALKNLRAGLRLGGKALTREQAHERTR